MTANWPLTAQDLRDALDYLSDQGNVNELTEFIEAACEWVDRHTGRDLEPTRHELAGGTLPKIFKRSAKATAKLWWEQEKNGSRGRPPQGDDPGGPPAGADAPRKVHNWLADYPPRLYIPDETDA